VFDKSGTGAKLKFADVVKKAYMDRINLGAQAFYKTPGIHFDTKKRNGKPFYYFVFGAALSQVEIDTLTGATKVEKVFIVHENGQSVNLEVDLGQIEGAYIQSMGWVTMEEVVVNGKGENLSNTTSTYKIPTYDDIPGTFEVEILSRDRKFSSVFGSKGIGEPPFIYGISAFLAIKDAVESVGNHKFEVELQSPATPERVLNAVEKIKHYADDGDI
jgi:xanthine dehydrogenase large subunit